MTKQFHPLADLLPMMTEEEFVNLKASIEKVGLLEPITLHPDGRILDGRNRYKACVALSVEPHYTTFDGELNVVSIVEALNLARRHLTQSQKAMIGAKIEEAEAEEARKRMSLGGGDKKSGVVILPPPIENTGKAREKAAAIVGVSPKYVSDAKRIVNEAPDLAEHVRDGRINIPTAKVLAEVPQEERTLILSGSEPEVKQAVEQIKKAHVAHNSGNNEWYTPDEFLILARQVMGSIDLDPASSEIANERVNAEVFYTQEDDGLTKDWFGNVWMNPPYESGLIGKFAEKLSIEYELDNIASAIVLVNNATETAWFKTMVQNASAVCFPHSRIRFISPDGKLGAPLQGQAIIYLGDDAKLFTDTFQSVGWCAHVC